MIYSVQRALLAIVLCFATVMMAQARFVVVSPNGDELQQAFDNAMAGDIFFLKNGTYTRSNRAQYELPTNPKQNSINNITIIGESRDGVRIVGDTAGTADYANTMYLRGNDWYVENITVENVATKAQARALRTRGERMMFYNVKQVSHQDTHNADGGVQYFFKCETQGDVDFIYGDAAVMYDSSLIVSRKRGGGYITAPSDTKTTTGAFKHGILITNSVLLAEQGLTKDVYLGRPWSGGSSSVFFSCKMGSHIVPKGWQEWDNASKPGIYMAEWNSMDLNGTPISVSQRSAWTTQLTAADTAKYSIKYFFKGWNPRATLDAPMGMRVDGDSLRWRVVEGARGYLIYRNDSLQDFSERPAYGVRGKAGEKYTIRTLNQAGVPGSAVPRLENIITWEQDTVAAFGEPNIVLAATTNSGLPITYTSSDSTVLRVVNGTELEILWVDTVVVTATQAGNATYTPATPVSKTFIILAFRPEPPTGVNQNAQIPVKVYPNPVADLLNLNFDAEGVYKVMLMDLTGAVVYRANVKGNTHVIDAAQHSSGIYLLCIENAQKKRAVQKIEIK